jgi:hypothetical protein
VLSKQCYDKEEIASGGLKLFNIGENGTVVWHISNWTERQNKGQHIV